MDLFLPESGLIIWMLIAFLIVFFILAKVAWPMIMKSVDKRNQHIADSLKAAQDANEALAGVEQKRKEIMAESQAEQIKVMKESQDLKNQIIEEAKDQARIEAEKIVAESRVRLQKEQEEAMAEVKNEVVALSISIAEKLLTKELDDKKSQSEYIEQLLKKDNNIQA